MIPQAPFGNTVFCDDIRDEVGGKHSFMGVYAGDIRLSEIPASLAKFGFGVRYFHAADDARDPVILRIFMPGTDGDVLALEAELPIAQALQGAGPTIPVDGETPLVGIFANIVLAPFQVSSPGRIKVRAYVGPEEQEIRLGSIAIVAAPIPSAPDESAP